MNVRALKTVASDSNGVIAEVDYGATNGLLTVLPETAGSFKNDAKATYKEPDPGQNAAGGTEAVTTERDINADGSYRQTTATVDVSLAPVTNTATEAADFSGTPAARRRPRPADLHLRRAGRRLDRLHLQKRRDRNDDRDQCRTGFPRA